MTSKTDESPISDDLKAQIQAMTFEDAMMALEDVVSRLESGGASLEESIDLYARGTALKAHCDAKLKGAQAKIEKLTLGEGGPVGAAPLDVGDSDRDSNP
ncbi:exodeoxyribonuclease VII small subunit [Eilatimonas milleporae]|uniref:Exodeoxyribonuclease 7 small subunit n=1 Tax=Eilatimonas milleporae TaxID=911205 RepID=A0A3M0CFN1_9PROT|nr:exodeoxyribonuclease VII small subunit [Eilatimonas milleporae]RMB08398.1 exodeoxyribonuclease VII small subunit [Eilatimonas milleporae]